MSIENQNENKGGNHLQESEIDAEIKLIVERNILPPRVAQKIIEKIKERNIKISKEQLYRLIEKIQNALQTYTPRSSSQSPQAATRQTLSAEHPDKKIGYETEVYTADMKQLVETVEQLKERLKTIEENRIDGVKGITGRLVTTKDVKVLHPSEILGEDMQPLEQIPSDPESIVVIMKWLQYLVEKTGKNNLGDVLGYYVDIGWISDDVRLDLINYSKGITEDPGRAGASTPHLPTRDHLQSLLFIQKLKGIQLDDRFLSKIERDMEKMAKSLEGYQLK